MRIEEIKISYMPRLCTDIRLTSSKAVFDFIIENWDLSTIQLYEEFKVIYLNRHNNVLGVYTISRGGIAGTVVDPKLVFAVALKVAASSLILVHNHPSGNVQPSEADKSITKRLRQAGDLLEVNVLDHLIVTAESFYSFSDECRL